MMLRMQLNLVCLLTSLVITNIHHRFEWGAAPPHTPAFLLIAHHQQQLATRTTDDLARAMAGSVTGSVTGK